MNFPKHIQNIPENKQAFAPYNFVELSDQVVSAQLEPNGKLRDNNCYYSDRNTGKIECTLTTSSPLYIRCGLTKEQFKEKEKANGEAKDIPEFYYIDPDTKQPVIPGSSLRGMLRTLVEIVSFSKIDRVSGHDKFFFRAVAAENDDPTKKVYDNSLGKNGNRVRAGYLQKIDDQWYIRPAKKIDRAHFAWIKEVAVQSELSNLILMENILDYRPQYFVNISFEDIATKNNRVFAHKISSNCQQYKYLGVLVTSGNMLEGAPEGTQAKRKNHCLIREPDPTQELIQVDKDTIQDYLNSLTAFQKQDPPFDQNMGFLKHGRTVFYCQPEQGGPIKLFGQSPFFRIPFLPKNKTRAASAVDFIPLKLKEPEIIDIADAIFGWVRQNDNQNKLSKEIKEIKQRAGRIFISDAKYAESSNNVWYNNNTTVTPKILASPKPTTFQHYLVQPEKTNAEKINLKHYADEPIKETVIRGHKLYWHKGSSPQIEHPNSSEANESQLTAIKPINTDVKFNFIIHFENLTNIELGALIWVLNIAQDESYRLKLGMGKPLGMGAVKIEHNLYLSDRQIRYTQLFNDDQWETAEQIKENLSYQQDFEKYILEQICPQSNFKDIPRIRMLLEMLRWPGPVDIERKTRYMEIERNKDNEYKKRPVLPTPLQVVGIELTNTPFLSPINSNLPENISQKFSQGQEVDAQVIDIEPKSIQKGNKTEPMTIITYQIQGSDCKSTEEIRKHEIDLQLGMTVKVRIDKVKNNNVRKVKRVGIVE
jgi:CRISPR-associated protein (TIGR03986 family)